MLSNEIQLMKEYNKSKLIELELWKQQQLRSLNSLMESNKEIHRLKKEYLKCYKTNEYKAKKIKKEYDKERNYSEYLQWEVEMASNELKRLQPQN